jgi:hypothetical protein
MRIAECGHRRAEWPPQAIICQQGSLSFCTSGNYHTGACAIMSMKEDREKTKQQHLQVIEAQNKGCLSILIGAIMGGIVSIIVWPVFGWWMEYGFEPDEIPDNKLEVAICAALSIPLFICLGAFICFKLRHRFLRW